jgi:hypothetical protein
MGRTMNANAKNVIRNIMSDGKERSLTVLFEDIAASATWKAKRSIPTVHEACWFLTRELKCSTRKVYRSEPITLMNGQPDTYQWVETVYCL